MPLEDLMHNIILYHHSDYLRHGLERHDMRLSQRNTEAELHEQLDMKLRQFSVDHSPYWLVIQLCNKDGLVAIMEGQFRADFPGIDFRTLDMSTLAKYVLDAFKIPLLKQCKGRERILHTLYSYKEQMDMYIRQQMETQRRRRCELHMRR